MKCAICTKEDTDASIAIRANHGHLTPTLSYETIRTWDVCRLCAALVIGRIESLILGEHPAKEERARCVKHCEQAAQASRDILESFKTGWLSKVGSKTWTTDEVYQALYNQAFRLKRAIEEGER